MFNRQIDNYYSEHSLEVWSYVLIVASLVGGFFITVKIDHANQRRLERETRQLQQQREPRGATDRWRESDSR